MEFIHILRMTLSLQLSPNTEIGKRNLKEKLEIMEVKREDTEEWVNDNTGNSEGSIWEVEIRDSESKRVGIMGNERERQDSLKEISELKELMEEREDI